MRYAPKRKVEQTEEMKARGRAVQAMSMKLKVRYHDDPIPSKEDVDKYNALAQAYNDDLVATGESSAFGYCLLDYNGKPIL